LFWAAELTFLKKLIYTKLKNLFNA